MGIARERARTWDLGRFDTLKFELELVALPSAHETNLKSGSAGRAKDVKSVGPHEAGYIYVFVWVCVPVHSTGECGPIAIGTSADSHSYADRLL